MKSVTLSQDEIFSLLDEALKEKELSLKIEKFQKRLDSFTKSLFKEGLVIRKDYDNKWLIGRY